MSKFDIPMNTSSVLARLCAAALLAGGLASAHAASHRDPATGCVVIAPEFLASSDYVFSYQGGCRDGLAEGKGRAVWALRLSPQNTRERAGRFSAGVFLPEPSDGLRARALKGEDVLFDLGSLPTLKGVSPRLAVEASGNATELADPCRPYALWVLKADGPSLVSDDLAKQLLQSALDKLMQRCGADSLRALPSSVSLRSHLRVRAVAQAELTLDRYGNPQGTVIEALLPLEPGQAMEQYSNQLASQLRQRQEREAREAQRQANVQRLKAFAQPLGAGLWVSLPALAQNPFRYQGQVVLTSARLDEVLAPTRARLLMPEGYGVVFASLDGEGIAQWAPGSRVLAVRVQGRLPNTDELLPGVLQLQLVGQLACAEPDCSDRLSLPNALRDGEAP
jgi:hypothetical protein